MVGVVYVGDVEEVEVVVEWGVDGGGFVEVEKGVGEGLEVVVEL